MKVQDLAPKSVGAVANAVAILRYLAQLNGRAGVAAVARETSVNVSTCFNILRTLAAERLVVFDPVEKTYRIGLGVLEFSAPLLGSNQTSIIRPELERLARERSTLIGLWQITRNDRIILADRVSGARIVRVDMNLGARLPAYAGAIGRCFAAAQKLGPAKLEKRFRQVQWQSPPSFEQYMTDVTEAAKTGYAFDFGQLFIGLEIGASIISDAEGRPSFGISSIAIAGQVKRADIKLIAEDIRDTADWISERLFGAPARSRQALRGSMAHPEPNSLRVRLKKPAGA